MGLISRRLFPVPNRPDSPLQLFFLRQERRNRVQNCALRQNCARSVTAVGALCSQSCSQTAGREASPPPAALRLLPRWSERRPPLTEMVSQHRPLLSLPGRTDLELRGSEI